MTISYPIMTDLKTNLKTLTKEIFDKIDKLELHIEHVKKGLSDLLDEDDIVSLPSYQLLKSVYGEYLNDKPEKAKTKEEKIDEIYDPLYAPSTTRRKGKAPVVKNKVQVTANVQKVKTETKPEPKKVSDPPSFMPDFGESLLEAKAPVVKKKALSVVPAKKSTEDIKVVATETVYKIEINGAVYLRYDKYLYDENTHYRVGSISKDNFIIGSEKVNIASSNSIKRYDGNYFIDEEEKLYLPVNKELNVYQAVGEITDNEVGLWE